MNERKSTVWSVGFFVVLIGHKTSTRIAKRKKQNVKKENTFFESEKDKIIHHEKLTPTENLL